MSIASEINRINTNISAAYDAAEAKGATMPAAENSANLPTAIRSIPEAVQPTLIPKQITENGTYTAEDDNADGYSEVTVAVPTPIFESRTVTPTAIQFDVEPSVGFDGLSKVTVLAALFGIDAESLSHFEFGIDNEGLYYTDEVGGGTPVYMGVDARGLYVTGGVVNG